MIHSLGPTLPVISEKLSELFKFFGSQQEEKEEERSLGGKIKMKRRRKMEKEGEKK